MVVVKSAGKEFLSQFLGNSFRVPLCPSLVAREYPRADFAFETLVLNIRVVFLFADASLFVSRLVLRNAVQDALNSEV